MAEQLDLFIEADKQELADLREFFHNVNFCVNERLEISDVETLVEDLLLKHPQLAIDPDPPYPQRVG